MKNYLLTFSLLIPLLTYTQSDSTYLLKKDVVIELKPKASSGFTASWFFEKLLPSFIGAGSALIIFYLTSRRDRRKESKKKADDRIDKVNYIRSLLENVIKVTEQLRDNLVMHVKSVRKDTVNFKLISFVPLTSFARSIETLGRDEYYSAFSKHFKNKLETAKVYQRIISNVDYLHAQFLAIPEMLKLSQQFDTERKVQYKDVVDQTLNNTANMLYMNHGLVSTSLKPFDDVLREFLINLKDHSDLNYYNENFVLPMQEAINQTLYGPQPLPLPVEIFMNLSESLRNAMNFFEVVKKSNHRLGNDIEQITHQVSDSLKQLNELLENFPKLHPLNPAPIHKDTNRDRRSRNQTA